MIFFFIENDLEHIPDHFQEHSHHTRKVIR